MRNLPLFLIAFVFALGGGVKARELEDSQGLSPPLYTTLQPESLIDRRVEGGIDSFASEASKDRDSCISCGS